MSAQLSDVEEAMLQFEGRYWRLTGVKERAIRETFGMTSTDYYHHLARLIDRPEALAANPIVVKKLLAQRESRARARRERRKSAADR